MYAQVRFVVISYACAQCFIDYRFENKNKFVVRAVSLCNYALETKLS